MIFANQNSTVVVDYQKKSKPPRNALLSMADICVGFIGIFPVVFAAVGFILTILIASKKIRYIDLGQLIRFYRTLLILSLLKYINLEFGPMLREIMEIFSNIHWSPSAPESIFYLKSTQYFQTTKGKLTMYDLNLYLLDTIPWYISVYNILGILEDVISLMAPVIKHKEKQGSTARKLMKSLNYTRKLKYFIYRMIIFEYIMYIMHGYLHTAEFGEK
jgi:hypothetical protein